MRLLYVVQRYGREVAGGAELHCRQFATKLAARGHDVDVVTSCALGYLDWADHYPPGTSDLDGVSVHRLPVARRRDNAMFGRVDARTVHGRKPVPLHLQEEWMRLQGPEVTQLQPWLRRRVADYDVVVFFTYLYFTTWAGLPVAAAHAPTVLHPTAHDEPPLSLPLFDTMFRHPTAFAFSTEEERDLLRRRFRFDPPGAVVGIGFDLDHSGDAARFRHSFGVGDDPYLLYVGRIDTAKGAEELFDLFAAYKARNPGPLRLVLMGEAVRPLPPHPDVVATGHVSDDVKHDAYEGAVALVQPSYFESFSMVLAEAAVHATPALVQSRNDVLMGHARRSGGALPYAGFAEFEAAVQLLAGDHRLQMELGERARRYVEWAYPWDAVLSRYEALLDQARGGR